MQTHPDLNYLQKHSLLLRVVRLIWLVLAILLIATFILGIPVRINVLQRLANYDGPSLYPGLPPDLEAVYFGNLGTAEAEALQNLGISLGFYIGYLLTFEIALALVSIVTGVFIFWRRSDDWLTLWVSLVLVLLGTNSIAPEVPALSTVTLSYITLSTFAGFIGMVSNVYILFLSPDGRFVPRWTNILAAGFALVIIAFGMFIFTQIERLGLLKSVSYFIFLFSIWMGILGLGVACQIYRYKRVSGPVQRQQTKWVVVGLAAVVLGLFIHALFLFLGSQQSGLQRVLLILVRTPITYICMMLLPVCMAFSILRYRLWDIDLIIRRTLIYSTLTATLALVYLSTILVLQNVVNSLISVSTPIVTVVSTLIVAALFNPLRIRIQDFIDRKFYRRKYDAERVLSAFSTNLREEVDLDRLAEMMLEIVEDTIQPAHHSLWVLSPPSKERSRK